MSYWLCCGPWPNIVLLEDGVLIFAISHYYFDHAFIFTGMKENNMLGPIYLHSKSAVDGSWLQLPVISMTGYIMYM
jgi:hypothetical protein